MLIPHNLYCGHNPTSDWGLILRYLLGSLLFLGSYAVPAMTFSQAQVIYERLAQANHIVPYPGLYLVKDSSPNASAGAFSILINTGMLTFARNADELALVLGHELGHYSLGHTVSTPSNEFAADALGAKYEDRAGYNHCRGVNLLFRFHDKADATHPDSTERYNRLRCFKNLGE